MCRLIGSGSLLLLVLLMGAGCSGITERGYWGAAAGWPDGERLARSAVAAARSPHTWIPLAGAVVFGATDLDREVSEWAAEKTPLFGSDAESASDTLRGLAAGGYLLTALAVPSDSSASRATGLAVGLSAVALERATVSGLKQLVSRDRPDGSDDLSFPSGHTSLAATTATMAADNLAYTDLPEGAGNTARVGLYGIAAGTGWARIEAGKHYPSDVLAGYAIGHFIARFTYHAFLMNGEEEPPVQIALAPLPGGAVLTLTRVLY